MTICITKQGDSIGLKHCHLCAFFECSSQSSGCPCPCQGDSYPTMFSKLCFRLCFGRYAWDAHSVPLRPRSWAPGADPTQPLNPLLSVVGALRTQAIQRSSRAPAGTRWQQGPGCPTSALPGAGEAGEGKCWGPGATGESPLRASWHLCFYRNKHLRQPGRLIISPLLFSICKTFPPA